MSDHKKIRKDELFKALEKVKEFNENGKVTVAIYSDVYFPRVDGVLKVVDNVAERLSKRCNVVVFAPSPIDYKVEKNYLFVRVKSLYMKGLNYDLSLPSFDKNLKKIVKNLRIDIIHSHTPFMLGKKAIKASKKKRVPLVFTFHSQFKKDIYKATKSNLLTKIGMSYIMSSFAAADEVWTMHEMSAKTIREYGYKGDIYFMPNATDFSYPKTAKREVAEIRSRLNIDEEVVFLFVGRLVVQKNILFIAEVLGALKKRGLKFKMIFVGDGPDRKELEKTIAREDVEDECVFLGKVNDYRLIEDYYLTADLVLFPSKYDVSSIIQLEAAAMKTPCAFVSGSVTSCTVTHEKNGYILPDDPALFADEVYKIASDKEALKKMGENAYRDLYVTWDEVVDKTYERYEQLIKDSVNKN